MAGPQHGSLQVDRDQVRTRVQDLLRDIVDDDGLKITDTTTAADVDWWDSLTHLKLLVAIEEAWDLNFQVAELSAPENVGELVDLIRSKMPA
jgi:acyl carrier protein